MSNQKDKHQKNQTDQINHENKIITLKYKELIPNNITIFHNQTLQLKIGDSNQSKLSDISRYQSKKPYYFLIQQTDQEIGPLYQGNSFQFNNNISLSTGDYTLICTNYPKISAKIYIQKNPNQKIIQSQSQQKKSLKTVGKLNKQPNKKQVENDNQSSIQNLQSSSKKQLQSKQLQISIKHSISTPPQKTDYDLVLQQQTQSINHRYLRYFRQQFKLWRNFFETENQKAVQQIKQKQPSLPKQKKNQRSPQKYLISPMKKQKSQQFASNSIRPSSAMSNYQVPSINNDKSVDSHMYSHQGLLQRNEQILMGSETRGMKKTNSQYLVNISRSDDKQVKTQTETQTVIDWAISQSSLNEDLKDILINKKSDHSLVKQYLTFLHNRFEISRFLHS